MKKIKRNKIKWRSGLIPGTSPLQTIQDRSRLTVRTRHWLGAACVVIGLLFFVTLVLGQSIEPIHNLYSRIAKPFQRAYLWADDFVTDTIASAKRLKSLEEENQRLIEELEYYVYENTTLKTEVVQSQEIQALYDLDHYYAAYPKTGAQIVGLSANNWYESVIIDKGSADGLVKDMPVLASGGLLGRITTVYEHYSIITTLIHKDSRIFGEVNRLGRDTVNVSGSSDLVGSRQCRIQYDPSETDLAVGDEIVTSALGEIYPPGILIGTVTSLETDENGVTSTAYVKPAAETDGLNYVLIITELWKDGMKEELEGENRP